MQPIRTIWTIAVGSGSREEVDWTFPYIIQCKIVTPGVGSILAQGHSLNNFSREPLDDAILSIALTSLWRPDGRQIYIPPPSAGNNKSM